MYDPTLDPHVDSREAFLADWAEYADWEREMNDSFDEQDDPIQPRAMAVYIGGQWRALAELGS